jgi:hypothetical protein
MKLHQCSVPPAGLWEYDGWIFLEGGWETMCWTQVVEALLIARRVAANCGEAHI